MVETRRSLLQLLRIGWCAVRTLQVSVDCTIAFMLKTEVLYPTGQERGNPRFGVDVPAVSCMHGKVASENERPPESPDGVREASWFCFRLRAERWSRNGNLCHVNFMGRRISGCPGFHADLGAIITANTRAL